MRIVFVDRKYSIEEPSTTYFSMVDAVAALDKLLSQGLAKMGQVLDFDGKVLLNKATASDDEVNPTSQSTI